MRKSLAAASRLSSLHAGHGKCSALPGSTGKLQSVTQH